MAVLLSPLTSIAARIVLQNLAYDKVFVALIAILILSLGEPLPDPPPGRAGFI